MKVRDGFAKLNGDETTTDMPSGSLDIVADDGRTLFSLRLKGNVLEVDAGHVCKHGDELLDDRFSISPRAANLIDISKNRYEP